MFKRVISVMLAGVLTVGVLGGCGGDSGTAAEGDKGSKDQSAGEAQGTDVTGGLVSTGAEAGDDNSFRILTVRWADWGTDFLKGFVDESEKAANVHVDWEVYVNSDWTDKKGVLMASGDLPDAFWGSICLNDADLATNAEYIIPLEDLIQENMPNLTAIFEEDPEMKAICTSMDGHIYGLPKKLPCRPTVGNQVFINQTWLDNLNLEMPDTYEDFYNVLKAFKEQDANGNGDPDDEIPFGAGNTDPIATFLLPFEPIGTNKYNMILKDGEPAYRNTTDSYKEGLAWMHKCYEEGLIDPEIFTQDGSMAEAKRMDPDGSLVGVAGGWVPTAVFGDNAGDYTALTPVAGPDGNRYVESDPGQMNYSRNELVVTTQCKNPAALLKWADQFYTEDATIQTYYGSFGTGVSKGEDGVYTVLDPPEGKTADLFIWENSFRDFGPKYAADDINDRVVLNPADGDGLKLEIAKIADPYAVEPFPNVSYTAEQLEQLSTLYSDLISYVSTMETHWITEGGIEDEWDGYIDQLNQMGFDQFMNIQKEAFDNYNSALTK